MADDVTRDALEMAAGELERQAAMLDRDADDSRKMASIYAKAGEHNEMHDARARAVVYARIAQRLRRRASRLQRERRR